MKALALVIGWKFQGVIGRTRMAGWEIDGVVEELENLISVIRAMGL